MSDTGKTGDSTTPLPAKHRVSEVPSYTALNVCAAACYALGILTAMAGGFLLLRFLDGQRNLLAEGWYMLVAGVLIIGFASAFRALRDIARNSWK